MYLCGMGDKKTNRRFYNGKKYGVSFIGKIIIHL
jgi:hypothetical protein